MMSKRLADDCGEIVSSKRQQNESSGSDEAAIRDHIKFLVGNVQLCYDGADILHRDRYDLGKLFETRFGLSKEVAAAVKKETDSAVEYYSSALADKYKNLPSREPEPCSPSNSNEDNSKQVDDFEEYVHTVRKVNKLLAKSVHLKDGGAALTSAQKEFLLGSVDKISASLKQGVQRATKDGPDTNLPLMPQYYPLYIRSYIDQLFDKIVAAADLSTAFQVDIYMAICRQMVLFVPMFKHPSLEKDIVTTFELDGVFRFRQGTYNIKNVFDDDFCKKCCEQIDVIRKRQAEGVVHFVSKAGDLPSRRVWDLLENDSSTSIGHSTIPDGVFRQQVRNPVIVAINACTLGTDWRIGSLAINETIPGSVGQEEHIDYTKWRKYGPYFCEFPRGEGGCETESLQGTVVFEPFTVETGGTGIIPGSQLWEVYPFTKDQHEEFVRNEVVACCDPGDYLVFNPNCQHRGRGNVTIDRTRKAGIYQFVMGGLQPMEYPGPHIQGLIDKPDDVSNFWDHYLARIHSWRYPQHLSRQAKKKNNAEGNAYALREELAEAVSPTAAQREQSLRDKDQDPKHNRTDL